MNKKKIALFASGSGTNVQNIIEYFAESEFIEVDSVWSNKKDAYVLKRAESFGIESFAFNRDEFARSNFERLI